MRVKGHTLRAEGAAHEARNSSDRATRQKWNSISGTGFGICSCGARSPILNTGQERKDWHRDHKREVSA